MEFLLSDSVLSSEGRTEDAVRGVSATLAATAVIDVSASTGSRLLLLWMTTAETIMTAAQRQIAANIAFFLLLVRYFMRRRNGFLSSDFFLCTCKLMFPLCLPLPQPASQIAQPQAERRIYQSISIALIFFCRPKGNKGTGEIQPVFNGRTEIPRFFDDHTEHRDSDRTAHNTGEIKQSKHRKSGFRRRLRNPLIS